MAAIFMASCYQAEFRHTSGKKGNGRSIVRILFRKEPETHGNLRAGEELAALKSKTWEG